MTIKHLYPVVEPSLNLDFANSKKLDPRITFTRASTGTYVGADGLIKTAAANQARFDHDSDGNSLGLLIEQSRTNLVTYSQEFDNAAWVKTNSTITANAATAPDGTTSADLLYPNSSGNDRGIYTGIGSTTNGALYTSSVYAKSSGIRYICLPSVRGQGNRSAWFDLQAGAVGTVVGGVTASIQNAGSGWYRCSVTDTSSGGSGYLGTVTLASADNSTSVTASGTNGVLLWGAQLETGSFPTSYIPTTSSTVTRAADVASMTGTNFSSWYNQSEGTLSFSTLSKGNAFAGYIQGASTINRIDPYQSNSFPVFVVVNNGTNLLNAASTTAMSFTSTQKFAVGIKQGDYALAQQGAITITGTNATPPPTVTQMFLGRQWTPLYLNGTIARLTYYPVRLPDATLQALTL